MGDKKPPLVNEQMTLLCTLCGEEPTPTGDCARHGHAHVSWVTEKQKRAILAKHSIAAK